MVLLPPMSSVQPMNAALESAILAEEYLAEDDYKRVVDENWVFADSANEV